MKKITLGILCIIFFTTISNAQNYSEEWSHGSEITITAEPNPGWEFINWTDRITGEFISNQNPYLFIVTGEVDYFANFQQIILQLVLNNNPTGGGITFGAGEYTWGSEVTISTEPNDGFTFLYWINDLVGDTIFANQHSFIINENSTSYTAYYELGLYWVNVTINPEGAGMVIGDGIYFEGGSVELYSEPNINWKFENWENVNNGEIIKDNPYIFKIYEDYDFIANFIPETNGNVSNEIKIYPNPTKNQLFIETPENSNIKIITLNGKRIFINSELLQTLHQINVSTLEPGVYLIQVEVNEVLSYYKFIVQ